MTRETFSVEHKVAWLNSEDPLRFFFDLENIDYSHISCNIRDGASKMRKYESKEQAKKANLQKSKQWKDENRVYDPEERRERYLRLGT
jgi:hypothetical protein